MAARLLEKVIMVRISPLLERYIPYLYTVFIYRVYGKYSIDAVHHVLSVSRACC